MIGSRPRLERRALFRLAPLLAALTLTSIARPAAAGDGAAAAEVLFSEGKRLVQEGNYAAACPKFEESQKVDPGMGTLYRLADCYEHVGRTASAWASFLEVAGSAKTSGQQARADDARKRAGDLEPNLPKLLIRVADPDVAGLVVKRGDVVVGRAQWNTPIPVDPGHISLEASAPGRKTWRSVVAVQERATGQIEIPLLAIEAAASTPAVGSPPPDTKANVAPPEGGAPFGTQRTVAVVAGAAGVVALGVGSVFGIVSMSKKGDADKHCDANNVCDDEGLGLRRNAISAGSLSSIGFVAGGVLAAAGVVLWFTAPPRAAKSGATAPPAPRAGIAPRWGGITFEAELP